MGLGSDGLSLAMNNLGLCYVRMRRYAEAKPLLEQALAIEGRSSQREDFFYATILNNLAELELGFENLDEANRLCREGLNLRESIGNPEKLGRSYVTMAMVCALRGEHEAAEEFFIKALRNREDVYGLDHPELLLTLRRYSEWLKTRGRADEGVALDVRIGLICGHYRISINAV
jgi:tetratricopeptide (TPR) repeat protein